MKTRADTVTREDALNFTPDWKSEDDLVTQFKEYISDLPSYEPPTTMFSPTFYSTYDGSKEAYVCENCRILLPKIYVKNYEWCPGCGLKIRLGSRRLIEKDED